MLATKLQNATLYDTHCTNYPCELCWEQHNTIAIIKQVYCYHFNQQVWQGNVLSLNQQIHGTIKTKAIQIWWITSEKTISIHTNNNWHWNSMLIITWTHRIRLKHSDDIFQTKWNMCLLDITVGFIKLSNLCTCTHPHKWTIYSLKINNHSR